MTNKHDSGLFITLEGIEGVGKSTHLQFIKSYLEKFNIPVITTREPGGTEVAEAIRQVLLAHYQEPVTPQTELLLMFAARSQHLASFIIPTLQNNKWVICDRFTDATYAYQGGGRGIPLEEIAGLERWVQNDLVPDYVLLFDAPVELALARAKGRGNTDRFEAEDIAFFERVRQAYLTRAKQYPQRYSILDASLSLSQVQENISQILDQFIQRTPNDT